MIDDGITDKEAAEWLRKYVMEPHSHWSWPTDGCGYDQHIKFVKHRNENWHGPREAWNQFVLDYADSLDGGNNKMSDIPNHDQLLDDPHERSWATSEQVAEDEDEWDEELDGDDDN